MKSEWNRAAASQGRPGAAGSLAPCPASRRISRAQTGAQPPWLGALTGFSSSQQHQINMEQGLGGKTWNRGLEGLPVLLPSSPGGGILSGISAAGSSRAPAACTELQGPGEELMCLCQHHFKHWKRTSEIHGSCVPLSWHGICLESWNH